MKDVSGAEVAATGLHVQAAYAAEPWFRRGLQLTLITIAASAGTYARTALGPIQEPLRIALSLSDNKIALLQGPALALPLILGAIPLGLVVDRFARVRLLQVSILVVLLASGLTFITSSFPMLFLSRCLVGLAAPATGVIAYSLVADLYPTDQRGRATMAILIGQVVGMSGVFILAAGFFSIVGNRPEHWRQVFLLLMVPVVVALFLTVAMREPQRAGVVVRPSTTSTTFKELWSYKAIFGILLAGVAMVGLADGAALVWAAPSLSRIFGLSTERAVAIIGSILFVAGIAGPLAGGGLSDLCQRIGGPRCTARLLIVLAVLSVPGGLFAVVPTPLYASIALGVLLTVGATTNLIVTTLTVVILPNELRGLCTSINWAVGSVFGFGLAPLAVSLLSNAIGGQTLIGESLAIVCVTTSFVSVAIFAVGAHCFSSDPVGRTPTRGPYL